MPDREAGAEPAQSGMGTAKSGAEPALSSKAPALAIKGVAKAFTVGGRTIQALAEVSLKARPGVVTGLVGPDAAGKTTLLRCLAGLLRPDSGQLSVLGRDVLVDPLGVQASVAYMPQRFGLYEELTVQENLNLYADLQDVGARERRERYPELMRLTGLASFTGRLAGALSGGMKQKLGLACALVAPKELLLLDEPTVGVDPLSRRELWEIVYRVVEDQGVSVLLTTAYLDEAERCQEVVLLHQGRVLDAGRPGDFTREMQGRSFMVTDGGEGRRRLQRALNQDPQVLDALIHGAGVRIITQEARRPDLAGLEGGRDLNLTEVAPRFEDSFVARLLAQRELKVPQTEEASREGPAGSPHQGPVIEVRDLKRRFGDFYAVNGISFAVAAGEVYGLLGANGAGKSTTFRMLCGLLPPSAGSLRVAGHDLRKAAARARGSIGYMAQKFSLYASLSVRENLEFFSGAYGLRGRRREQRIQWALEEFGLAGEAGMPSGELPLGFRQRLALAAALIHEPEILFLDEPTSGVDPLARREFWRRINLLAESGVTVLVTTHFMEEAEYCDRVAIMDRGVILSEGTPQEIKEAEAGPDNQDPSLEEAFIALIERNEAPAGQDSREAA